MPLLPIVARASTASLALSGWFGRARGMQASPTVPWRSSAGLHVLRNERRAVGGSRHVRPFLVGLAVGSRRYVEERFLRLKDRYLGSAQGAGAQDGGAGQQAHLPAHAWVLLTSVSVIPSLGAMTVRWSIGTAAAALFVLLFLLIQLVVPIVALFGSRPGRLGWQMYSAMPSLPSAWTVSADGSLTRLHLADFFALQRAEIDYRLILAANPCEATDSFAIRLKGGDDQPAETIQCN